MIYVILVVSKLDQTHWFIDILGCKQDLQNESAWINPRSN